MIHPSSQPFFLKPLALTGLVLIPVFGYLFWRLSFPETIAVLQTTYQTAGESVQKDFQSLPALPLQDIDETYQIQDTREEGIDIQFANQLREPAESGVVLTFPKDYAEPLKVKLSEEKTFEVTDLSGKTDYTVDTLTEAEATLVERTFLERLFPKKSDVPQNYLRYTSEDERKSLLYAYQKDQATGERLLKHWTLYRTGTGLETETYRFDGAKLKKRDDGSIGVYYFNENSLKDKPEASAVEPNLLDRAQRVLAQDLLGEGTPDVTIPKPYVIDATGTKHDLEWQVTNEDTELSVTINLSNTSYPLALDPTLQFTAPGVSNSGSVITGEESSVLFGASVTIGDFNSDGKTDLAVGAYGYSSNTGRVYIFHNDGFIPTTAATADVIITGESTSNFFGQSLTSGDFNGDGRIDLAVGADGHSSGTGRRAYIFHNDGSIPTTAATADVTITGETTSGSFGFFLTSGDFNSDGRTDLAVGAPDHSSSTGRAYIFYNDGSIPTTAATADVTITGEATSNFFGRALTSGDFNSDGQTDLAVGASGYSSSTGRAYIFHNDGSIPTTAGTADVTITGEASSDSFGRALTSGDFNSDGQTDLAVGASGYSSSTGRAYIFYNDGSIPTTAATADVIITGETTSNSFGRALTAGDFNSDGKTDLVVGAHTYASSRGRAYIFYSQNGQVNTNFSISGNATGDEFGGALVTGDFNADGRTDLVVGAPAYSTNTGRVYLFYGDGQIPTTAATADATITGESTNNYFGYSLAAGDINTDGKTDLIVGAYGYSTDTGRVYVFYNGSITTENASGYDHVITGSSANYFSRSIVVGDFDRTGTTDIAAGGDLYSTSTGRAYVFYNDGSLPTSNASADVVITGETNNDALGFSMTTGDLNADGWVDLVVGAYTYQTNANTGRVYVFYNGSITTENASGADAIMTGEATTNNFGVALTTGDLNTDGKTDLVVGANRYSTFTGRVYVFYNGSITTENATGADVTITGGATNDSFGRRVVTGDLNADGRIDLAVGASGYTTNTGRTYIFHNDGSLPTTADSADIIITGETTNNYFGFALASGDMNGDGRTDLVVGAYGNTSSTGRVYIYETRENFAWEIQRQPQPGSGAVRTGLNTSGQEMRITGEASSSFGTAVTTGDLNSDGKPDLVVGASGYSSNAGRVYVFYNDGSLSTGATNADIVITGEASSRLGQALIIRDFNADGTQDLVVGASSYSSSTGRAYIFYNDGSLPTTAATADVTITGQGTSNNFGASLTAGDFNADGKTDLAVGASGYNPGGAANTGRAYIFYNGSIITENASGADIIITGESSQNLLGQSLTAGDFNSDGKIDFAVGASKYSSFTGRAYIFYNGSIITENASGADVTITGNAVDDNFGHSLTSGDFNADGRVDIAIGAYGHSSFTGRAYIFYNDGSLPTTAATADVTITGETSSEFSLILSTGDLNADGRTDLVVGTPSYSSSTGRAYIFHNDGSIPTTAATADVIITGGTTSDSFAASLTTGDFNVDGRTDLAVGASGYSSSAGRVYVYTFGHDPVITGGSTSDRFGSAMTTGDFNADGRTDLAIGAYFFSSQTGRAYIFYNDGVYPSAVASADVTITGEATTDYFGVAMTAGDFNTDGKVDIAIGASRNSTSTGKVYLFYNDGAYPSAAASADVTITGGGTSNEFGSALTSGDLNADGRMDIAVAAKEYSSGTGRVYIFHNDGSLPTTAGTADVTITGETAGAGWFGYSLATGDFNANGTTDLVASSYYLSSQRGGAYVFYNDGSIPTTAATADAIITGEASNNYFGTALAAGDMNADGKTDLIAGAFGYSSDTGRAYVFYNGSITTENASGADLIFTGETTSNYFGGAVTTGDLNADGRTDLIVGANGYSTNTGRIYIFHNDGSYPSSTASADLILSGEATSNLFGVALATNDLNADGKTDLVVGAYGYSSNTGRVYVFASETASSAVQPGTMYLKGTGKMKGTGKIK